VAGSEVRIILAASPKCGLLIIASRCAGKRYKNQHAVLEEIPMHHGCSRRGLSRNGANAGLEELCAPGRGPRCRRIVSASGLRLAALCSLLAGQLVAGAWAIDAALAQDLYPSKPVKIIVGMPAGSFTDLSARLIADGLRANLRESFIIENRPGAATNIATASVLRAPNDGYTLLLSTNSNTMNVSLFKELPFDVVRDFQPIAMIASSAFILAVTPSLPVSSVQELIAYAKDHPNALNFASTGAGTANHLAVEMLAKQAGIKLTTVFYKGSAEGITDVLAGRTHAMFTPGSTALPHVEAGKLKALAVTSRRRTALAPNIPTMAEAGLPEYEVAMWNGLSAPAGTPRDVVDRLAAAATKALASDELRSKIKSNGGDPIVMGPKEFSDYIREDIRRWSDVIREAGIKPQ
jgi:tripartite-type tricarboxylate transporter receptor subunit TctC